MQVASNEVYFEDIDLELNENFYKVYLYYQNKKYEYRLDAKQGKIIYSDFNNININNNQNDVNNQVGTMQNNTTNNTTNNTVIDNNQNTVTQNESQNNAPNNTQDNNQNNNQNSNPAINNPAVNTPNVNNTGRITLEQAKNIALKDANANANSVIFTKQKTDYDDFQLVYEIEFIYGQNEYEYEISANTGRIISFDRELLYH
ncbi:MAG: PepSY domain-containing protein [Clostridia bacterium]|nr:PepSY domain-containing protein [Clostridia bacterium]